MSLEALGLQYVPYIGDRLVYRIGLPSGQEAFLSHEPSASSEVVAIDAEAFIELWRASPYEGHKHLATGNPDTWRRDCKFSQAEEGFCGGATNPVPVPGISTYERVLPAEPLAVASRPSFWSRILGQSQVASLRPAAVPRRERSISVSDCTRTIWLLANGAPSIPVCVNARSAAELRAWGVGRRIDPRCDEAEAARIKAPQARP